MNALDGPNSAQMSWRCLEAEDAYQSALQAPGADLIEVAPDPRLEPLWRIRGILTAIDAVFRKGPMCLGWRRFYGWLLESRLAPGAFVLVIRGTIGFVEWLDDAEWCPRIGHPAAGEVESGFWGIYGSLTLRQPGGGADLPFAAAVTAIVGSGTLTVTGHSLGAAIANLAAFDLADPQRLSSRVSACLIASPKPGDAAFAAAFAKRCPSHVSWVNSADLVPRVPMGFGYARMPNVVTLDPAGKIEAGVANQHHAICYAYLQDSSSVDFSNVAPIDAPYASAIIRPQAPPVAA